MTDYFELGTTPYGEDCVPNTNVEHSKLECDVYIEQLKKQFPNYADYGRFKRQSNPHDFGDYYDVRFIYNDENDKAVEFAINMENNLPEYWTDESIQMLREKGYQI